MQESFLKIMFLLKQSKSNHKAFRAAWLRPELYENAEDMLAYLSEYI